MILEKASGFRHSLDMITKMNMTPRPQGQAKMTLLSAVIKNEGLGVLRVEVQEFPFSDVELELTTRHEK